LLEIYGSIFIKFLAASLETEVSFWCYLVSGFLRCTSERLVFQSGSPGISPVNSIVCFMITFLFSSAAYECWFREALSTVLQMQ